MAAGRLRARSWEQNGAKRTGVEMTVDNLGPNLRHTMATVVKVTRDAAPAAGAAASGARSRDAAAGWESASPAEAGLAEEQPPF